MEELKFNKFWNLLFSKICFYNSFEHFQNILDLWISYKIMPLFASFEQKLKLKKYVKVWDF
jgi:Na+/H+ antiporter NhaA